MLKISDKDLTDYQRKRIAELVSCGHEVVGSIYGMPTIQGAHGIFALTPLPPKKRGIASKEFLYITPIDREMIG